MAISQPSFAKELYGSRAETYEDSFHPSFVRIFLGFAPPQPGLHVLDLACGTDLVTFLAAEKVGRDGIVVGVDITPGMLFRAQERKAEQNWNNVKLFEHDIMDLRSLDYMRGKEESFDLIICASAFVLLGDPHAAVQHWKQYLKPGGKMIVDVPHTHSHIFGMLIERSPRCTGLHVPYNRSWVQGQYSLEQLLSSVGLEVEGIATVEAVFEGTRWHDGQKWDQAFEEIVNGVPNRELTKDEETRSKAKNSFHEVWQEALEDGRLREEGKMWVAVARKAKRVKKTRAN